MSTPICKVWDAEQGKYIGIPALKGTDGKSAYQYAVEGGYTGTETEFAEKLAAKKFANPNALTFTGDVTGSYDGSAAGRKLMRPPRMRTQTKRTISPHLQSRYSDEMNWRIIKHDIT